MNGFTNFLGKDNFTWWQGVVEDRNDPAKLGRCKVRIFGWHSEDLNLMPTKDLPWAIPASSPNSAGVYSVPDEGSYVLGFFQDGMAGQSPVIFGVLPGIFSKKPSTSKGFSPQGEQFKRTSSIMPPGEREREQGMGTPSQLFGGELKYTKIKKTNNNLAHACDVNFFMNLDLGLNELINPVTAIQQSLKKGKANAASLIRLFMNSTNEFLRSAVNTLIKAIGLDFSGMVSYEWTYVKAQIRNVNEKIKEVAEKVEIAATVVELGKQIGTLVEYFKSLPDKVLAMLQECVDQFASSINSIFNQLKLLPGASGLNNLQSILDSFSEKTASASTAGVVTIGNTSINVASSKLTANSVTIYINGVLQEQTNTNSTLANTAFNLSAFVAP